MIPFLASTRNISPIGPGQPPPDPDALVPGFHARLADRRVATIVHEEAGRSYRLGIDRGYVAGVISALVVVGILIALRAISLNV